MRNILFVALFLSLTLAAHADNLNVSEGSGKTMATDTVAGVEYQRMKIAIGADGEVPKDLSETDRMPVRTDRKDGFVGTNTNDITNTASTEVVPAGAAGVRHYAELWIVSNSSATVGTVVQLLDGTTPKAHCPASALFGGCVVPFPTPLRGSTATAWNCKNLTTGAAVRCTVTGFDLSE